MNTTVFVPSPPRRLSSRLTLAAIGCLLLSLLLTVLMPAPANAATYALRSGRIGSVTVNGPMINVYDLAQKASRGTYFYSKNFNVGGFTVTRSPSSYSQVVIGSSTIQRWGGGRWVSLQTRNWSGTVSGNRALKFPAWTWSPTNVPNKRAGYRVVFGIAWSDWSSGRTLGTTYVLPNTYADNRCSTRNFGCSTYTNGVNF